jgi:hypothetical protein
MNTMYKWGAITFGVGMALVILEIFMASRKKEGIEIQDKKRIKGIFWTVLTLTGIVMALIWFA